VARPRNTISDSALDRKLEALIEELKKENNWPPVAKKRGGLSKLNYLRDKLQVSFPRTRESVKRLGHYDLFAKGTRTVAQPRRIPPWVDDRIAELKESINPLTNKKYTRLEIVDQISSEGEKVSFDYVARGGYGRGDWTTPNKTRQEYAELHPDLESRLLSSDEVDARKAMEAAKSRELRKKNPASSRAALARFAASEYGQASSRFGDSLIEFKAEIKRIFPEDFPQILEGVSGKKASLEEILEHPLVKKKIGAAIKKYDLKLDKKTNKYVRSVANADALRALKNETVALFPKPVGPNAVFVEKLKWNRDRGVGLDSEEVQKLINNRASSNLSSLKTRSIVWSWDTVDGLPNGEEVPGSKKKVANLFFADDADEKAIREMYRRIAEDIAKEFYKTGVVYNIDNLDHIFPSGSVKIINGKLFGGAIDQSGKFLGAGVANLQNMRRLASTVNMSENKFVSPERIKVLKGLETPGAVSVEDTLKSLEGRTEAQRRYDTKRRIEKEGRSQDGKGKPPRFRWGGAAIGGFLGLIFAPWEKLRADPVTEIPSYLLEAGTGLKPQKAVQDTGRISPWRVGATIAQDTASDIAGLLRIDDPTEDDYVEAQQMGRKPDILTPQIYDDGKPTGIFGHPGIRDEIIRKRRPNIWT